VVTIPHVTAKRIMCRQQISGSVRCCRCQAQQKAVHYPVPTKPAKHIFFWALLANRQREVLRLIRPYSRFAAEQTLGHEEAVAPAAG
jgi:hypothetical protein